MKDNKLVLPIIILLLLVFLPSASYGLYKHFTNASVPTNPSVKDGKLEIYDNDKLIGEYKCENTYCNLAQTRVDDSFNNYYKNGSQTLLGVINNNYVFIQDGTIIKLYKIDTNETIYEYKLIKNYGTTIEGNYLIVCDLDGNYGLLNLNDLSYKIKPQYRFLGLGNKFNNNSLSSEKFLAIKDGMWLLIDINNQELTVYFDNAIYDYNENVICTFSDEYMLYNYEAIRILDNYRITSIDISDKFNILKINDSNIFIYSPNFSERYATYFAHDGDNLTYEINSNEVKIFNNNELLDTYKMEE